VNHSTTCRQPAYDAVFTLIRSLPTADSARNAVIWRAVTAALDATNVPDCQGAGHDSLSHSDDTGPNVEYRDFSRGTPGLAPPMGGIIGFLDYPDEPFDLSGVLRIFERHADDANAHAAAVEAAIAEGQCRAEYHKPNDRSARCELADGHDGDHRQQTGPDLCFNWPETIAMYGTDAEEPTP
jgi:hypothetical protein